MAQESGLVALHERLTPDEVTKDDAAHERANRSQSLLSLDPAQELGVVGTSHFSALTATTISVRLLTFNTLRMALT